jgi:F-type H+-transporting ATPase subunit b
MSQEVQIAAEATGGIATLGINLRIFIAQLINFSVVLLVLWKWAYKPIVKLLEERQEKIEKGVKAAEDAQSRILDIEKEHDSVIKTARGEAVKVMEEAQAKADERRKVLLEKAKDEVKVVVAQGKTQLVAQKEQMIREVREEIAKIAVDAARKILADAIDEKKAMKLATEVVDEMEKK